MKKVTFLKLLNLISNVGKDTEKLEELGIDISESTLVNGMCELFDAVMEGTATEAQKNVVVVNAAFAIQVICPDKPIEECIALARESLDSGKAKETLKKFVELNR